MVKPCFLSLHFASNQTEDIAAQQEDGAPGKKKRKKRKKKAKGAGEDAEAESEGPAIYQGPPKIEVIKMLYFHSNQEPKQFISIFKFLKTKCRFS